MIALPGPTAVIYNGVVKKTKKQSDYLDLYFLPQLTIPKLRLALLALFHSKKKQCLKTMNIKTIVVRCH